MANRFSFNFYFCSYILSFDYIISSITKNVIIPNIKFKGGKIQNSIILDKTLDSFLVSAIFPVYRIRSIKAYESLLYFLLLTSMGACFPSTSLSSILVSPQKNTDTRMFLKQKPTPLSSTGYNQSC